MTFAFQEDITCLLNVELFNDCLPCVVNYNGMVHVQLKSCTSTPWSVSSNGELIFISIKHVTILLPLTIVYTAIMVETKSATMYIQFMFKVNNEAINILYNPPITTFLSLFAIDTVHNYIIN